MGEKIILVLGGCRSGKSTYAKEYAERHFSSGSYIATAQGLDDEMRQRIQKHKEDRGPFWSTLEEPYGLDAVFLHPPAGVRVLLVDCITLWLTNRMIRDGASAAEMAVEEMLNALRQCPVPVILVSNEVGLGIVPENELARKFRDLAGFANQKIARIADRVVFMITGIPQILKQPHSPNA